MLPTDENCLFYNKLVLSTFHERYSVKLHMLIMTYPILDKKNIIGFTIYM